MSCCTSALSCLKSYLCGCFPCCSSSQGEEMPTIRCDWSNVCNWRSFCNNVCNWTDLCNGDDCCRKCNCCGTTIINNQGGRYEENTVEKEPRKINAAATVITDEESSSKQKTEEVALKAPNFVTVQQGNDLEVTEI